MARGEASPDSDVDVFVVLERLDYALKSKVIEVAAGIDLERGVPLSPTVIDEATYRLWQEYEWPLLTQIQKDGVDL